MGPRALRCAVCSPALLLIIVLEMCNSTAVTHTPLKSALANNHSRASVRTGTNTHTHTRLFPATHARSV